MVIARVSERWLCVALLTVTLKMNLASVQGLGDSCHFERSWRTYDALDLVRCLEDAFGNILKLRSQNEDKKSEESIEVEAYPKFAQSVQNDKFLDASTSYLQPQILSKRPEGLPNLSGLFDILTSISRHDDLKCIPRILCEAATGVIPSGRTLNYKSGQTPSLINFGSNALFGFFGSLNPFGTTAILDFARAALLGFSNRRNSVVCYRQYPRCPANPENLVYYLNNHNGGFFRLFGGQGNKGPRNHLRESSEYYHKEERKSHDTFPTTLGLDSEIRNVSSDTLGFMTSASHDRSETPLSSHEGNNKRDRERFVFPDKERAEDLKSFTETLKSLDSYEEWRYSRKNEILFPRDTDEDIPFPLKHRITRKAPDPQSPARLYLPLTYASESSAIFRSPDGFQAKINAAFTKLLSGTYRDASGNAANDLDLISLDLEKFRVVDLANLFTRDKTGLPEVRQPCDMVCHDSKGVVLQFSQSVSGYGAISTMMMPDHPVLDVAQPIPCEIMCIDRLGAAKQQSATLDNALIYEEPKLDAGYSALGARVSRSPTSPGPALPHSKQRPGFLSTWMISSRNQIPSPAKLAGSDMASAASLPGPLPIRQRSEPPLLQPLSPLRDSKRAAFSCTSKPCHNQRRIFIMCDNLLYLVPMSVARPRVSVCAVPLRTADPGVFGGGNFGGRRGFRLNEVQQRGFHVLDMLLKRVGEHRTGGGEERRNLRGRDPGGVDYPRVSCLADDTWDQDNDDCVPIKYDKDTKEDYMHVPGLVKKEYP